MTQSAHSAAELRARGPVWLWCLAVYPLVFTFVGLGGAFVLGADEMQTVIAVLGVAFLSAMGGGSHAALRGRSNDAQIAWALGSGVTAVFLCPNVARLFGLLG